MTAERKGTSLYEKFREMGFHGLIYGLGSSLEQAIGFILLPIYTHHLSIKGFGAFGLLTITGNILALLFGMGLTSSLFRSYYDYETPAEQSAVISTTIFIALFFSVALCGLGFFLSNTLAYLIFKSTEYAYHVFVVILVAVLRISLNQIPYVVFRVKKRPVIFITVRIICFVINALCIIWLVVYRELGILGVFYGQAIGLAISGILLHILIRKHLVLKIVGNELKKIIAFGFPVMVGGLGMMVFTYADKYMLKLMTDLREVGLYTLGYKFGMLAIFLLDTPIKMVWAPIFMSARNDDNFREFCSKAMTYVMLFASMLFLYLSLLAKDVIHLISPESYWDASTVVPIITLSYLIWTARYMVRAGIYIHRKMKIVAFCSLLGGLINISLNYWLIPEIGMLGAAYATLLSFSVMVTILFRYSQRLMFIKYEWRRMLGLLAIVTVIFFTGYHVELGNSLGTFGVKFLLISVLPGILYFGGFFYEQEKQYINAILCKILGKKSATV